MFTGIIESIGAVRTLTATAQGGHLVLADVPFAEELAVGESVAVNGCCLTVTQAGGKEVHVDILQETLRVTNLGGLQPAAEVNLERAVRVGDRMSGHYVQGHIDCVSNILALEPEGNDYRLDVALPSAFTARPRCALAAWPCPARVPALVKSGLGCFRQATLHFRDRNAADATGVRPDRA